MAKRRIKAWQLPIKGILLLNKPLGISSNKALQISKNLFKAQKAGHTGSLDPLATGILPICFGEATKISGYLLDSDKTYLTEAYLGETRTTGDAEGEVLQQCPVSPFTQEEVQQVLRPFIGKISQIPPMYSALKHQGKTLYSLARKGIEIKRQAREITIHELTLLKQTKHTLQLKIKCSKGTYIRVLIEDIGKALGCGAYVAKLERTQVSPFNQPSYTLEKLQKIREQGQTTLEKCLLPIDVALKNFPKIILDQNQSNRLQQGQMLNRNDLANHKLFRIYENTSKKFIGIAYQKRKNILAPKRLMCY